jgi:hypothetical protein
MVRRAIDAQWLFIGFLGQLRRRAKRASKNEKTARFRAVLRGSEK